MPLAQLKARWQGGARYYRHKGPQTLTGIETVVPVRVCEASYRVTKALKPLQGLKLLFLS